MSTPNAIDQFAGLARKRGALESMVKHRPMPFPGMPYWLRGKRWSAVSGSPTICKMIADQWKRGYSAPLLLPGEPGCPPLPEELQVKDGGSFIQIDEEGEGEWVHCRARGTVNFGIPVPEGYVLRTVSDPAPAEETHHAAKIAIRIRYDREDPAAERAAKLVTDGELREAALYHEGWSYSIGVNGPSQPGLDMDRDTVMDVDGEHMTPTHCPQCRTETSAHPLSPGVRGWHCESCGWPAMQRKAEPKPAPRLRHAPLWARATRDRLGVAAVAAWDCSEHCRDDAVLRAIDKAHNALVDALTILEKGCER